MMASGLKKYNMFRILLFTFVAAGTLFVASKCSPLYPFNDWPDINVFFTMGKGMAHGKVLYADYIDQKGPYLYALYALGYLLNHTTFLAIFLLEVISMVASFLLVHRILGLYLQNPDRCLWVYPLLSAGIVTSKSFVHGGSAEEFMIPFYLYGIFSLLRFLRSQQEGMSQKTFLCNGLVTGILFWTKYTALGFYLGWLLVVCLVMLGKKRGKSLLKGLCAYLVGVMIATIPWIVYFGLHHSIKIWLEVYLWNNIFHYATTGDLNLFQKIGNALLLAVRSLKDRENLCYSLWIVLGGCIFLLMPKKLISTEEKMAIPVLGILSSLGLFIGGAVQDYYVLPLAAFAVLGVLILGIGIERLTSTGVSKVLCKKSVQTALFVAVMAGSILFELKFSSNVYLLEYNKQDLPQFRFANIIEKSEDTSVLNYGFLDGGFYMVLDQVPDMRHFCTLNVDYFAILEKQNEYLRESKTEWVVTWRGEITDEDELNHIPVLTEYYELVDYVYFPLELDFRTYALYRRK